MRERTIAVILFVTLALAYAFVFPRWLDWNAKAHFDLSAAIVDQGTLSLSRYAWLSCCESWRCRTRMPARHFR